jgi:hypothetical protein
MDQISVGNEALESVLDTTWRVSASAGGERGEGDLDGPVASARRVVSSSHRARLPVPWVSSTRASARRALRPRGALRPVRTSRRARSQCRCAHRATGRRRVTRVSGAPWGRPAGVRGRRGRGG